MRIALTTHAVTRYRERVKPAMDDDAARADLERLLRLTGAQPTDTAPEWLVEREDGSAYLPVTDEVCLTLAGRPGRWRAVTCLVAGGFSPERRAARNKARKERRRRVHVKQRPGRPLNAT